MLRIADLNVERDLASFVERELVPDTGVDAAQFWSLLSRLVHAHGAKNAALLRKRDELQAAIDAYHLQRQGRPLDMVDYYSFLARIGYITPCTEAFQVTTQNVDPEIGLVAGPQLVCPCDNSRFLLNACNARWGSLLDALYGSDIIPEGPGTEKGKSYNPKRGDAVFRYAEKLLDEFFPLANASHTDVRQYSVVRAGPTSHMLQCTTKAGASVGLVSAAQFVGFSGQLGAPTHIVLAHNSLHAIIRIDPLSAVGKHHAAGMKDVVLESALSAIADLEDSMAAVDAQDKIQGYRNWNGIMRGTLSAKFQKGGREHTRALQGDMVFTAAAGDAPLTLKGRAVMLVRNVGIHMHTTAVTDLRNRPIPEGFLDLVATTVAGMADLRRRGGVHNSASGSIYIVKPKQHGPEEVAFTCSLFDEVESALGLPTHTLKIGIMDEERRTSVNLEECIRIARHRVVFINTGFLDRTGDEIRTSFEAAPTLPKAGIKAAKWISAYERLNVEIGVRVGLPGHGQIGKGMWAMPDEMKQMVDKKIEHPTSGATTAWVPSPTAATLHALHYHRVSVPQQQAAVRLRAPASLMDLLTPPLLDDPSTLTPAAIQTELDADAQAILGYVVRWVELGVGCSKIPDLNNVGLMEDRATLRINSQLLANWLHWGLITEEQAFKRIARIVDEQNKNDAKYRPMATRFDQSLAFRASLELVLQGRDQPNGYTEFILTKYRAMAKQAGKL
eukprot:CAMPEP_0177678758 /NCGR_PEP_ID=MMETSP0447-20121125/29185_1 /TAXON_ID=0 /ORGANISM="Stygamoeba regulata, Strain BSH-02190019" /LENGTH=726 /DNA_ID=CAMNT_0019187793 /DNA_START=166 /DNA_END=2347 /DNA_ORIENTATION=+